MKSVSILPIRPFLSFQTLKGRKQIKNFLDFLIEKTQDRSFEQNKCCFLVADALKDAYLFVVFCFGGLAIVDWLPNEKVHSNTKKDLQSELSKFNWNQKLPVYKIFSENAQKFGNLYPFIKKEVINNLTDEECQKIFHKTKQQSIFLNAVKIRKWEFGSYKQIKRDKQRNELDRVNGSNYLLIAATKEKNYYVGVFEFDLEFDSLASIYWSQDPTNSFITETNPPQRPLIKTQINPINQCKVNDALSQSISSTYQKVTIPKIPTKPQKPEKFSEPQSCSCQIL